MTQNPQRIAPGQESQIGASEPFGDSVHVCLDLVRRLYRATAGDGSWQAFASGLSEALAGAGVVLSLSASRDSALRHVIFAGCEAETARERVDALISRASESPEACGRFTRGFVSADDPSGAPNLAYLTAVVRDRPVASVVALRECGQPDFSPEERGMLGHLIPHLDRAYAMSAKFLGMAKQSMALAEVMNRLPSGILLLDERGHVVHRNQSARRILKRRDGFELASRRLKALDSEADHELQSLIRAVVSPSAAPDAGGILVARRPSGEPAYPVSVSRLLPSEMLREVVACVLVSDPDHTLAPALELMRNLHELTPAEAELVGQLAGGSTIDEAARVRGVSVNTMRSHLKHVFRKTGTNRQGELVQLVLRSFVPVIDE